jgi:hypothetical protein
MVKSDAHASNCALAARIKGFGVAVDADDLSGNMTSVIRAEKANHVGDFLDVDKLTRRPSKSVIQFESPDCFGIETETSARAIGYCDHAVTYFHGFIKQR